MVEFGVHITDAAIGLRRASENKEMWTENTAVLSVIELGKKKRYSVEIFRKILVRTSTAHRWRSSKIKLGHSIRNNQSNILEPYFQTLATKSQCL